MMHYCVHSPRTHFDYIVHVLHMTIDTPVLVIHINSILSNHTIVVAHNISMLVKDSSIEL